MSPSTCWPLMKSLTFYPVAWFCSWVWIYMMYRYFLSVPFICSLFVAYPCLNAAYQLLDFLGNCIFNKLPLVSNSSAHNINLCNSQIDHADYSILGLWTTVTIPESQCWYIQPIYDPTFALKITILIITKAIKTGWTAGNGFFFSELDQNIKKIIMMVWKGTSQQTP